MQKIRFSLLILILGSGLIFGCHTHSIHGSAKKIQAKSIAIIPCEVIGVGDLSSSVEELRLANDISLSLQKKSIKS